MDIQEKLNWISPYGDYDCEINTIIYWLYCNNFNPQPFYQYNWAFIYDANFDLLRGSISMGQALNFVKDHYKIEIEYCNELINIKYNHKYIVPLNSFFLPYISDYYKKTEVKHYVCIEFLQNEIVTIMDPVYRIKISVSYKVFYEIWNKTRESLILLKKSDKYSYTSKQVLPFILDTNYINDYYITFNSLGNRINQIYYENRLNKHESEFKKIFGYFQSILKARETYFTSTDYKTINNITDMWRGVTKTLMRMSMDPHTVMDAIVDSIYLVCKAEIEYLDNITLD